MVSGFSAANPDPLTREELSKAGRRWTSLR